jgi:hypothetical protein
MVVTVASVGCRRTRAPIKGPPDARPLTRTASTPRTATATKSDPSHLINTSTAVQPPSPPSSRGQRDVDVAMKYYANLENTSMAAVGADVWHTVSGGEVHFGVTRDKTETITGAFGRHHGRLRLNARGPQTAELIIDINSLRTQNLERDRRLLDVVFDSTTEARGVARLTLDTFDLGEAPWAQVIADDRAVIGASGQLYVNNATVAVSGTFGVNASTGTLSIHSVDPVKVSIIALGLETRVRTLMRLCNVADLTTLVNLEAQLSFQKSDWPPR